jgi:hypothetical protein
MAGTAAAEDPGGRLGLRRPPVIRATAPVIVPGRHAALRPIPPMSAPAAASVDDDRLTGRHGNERVS